MEMKRINLIAAMMAAGIGLSGCWDSESRTGGGATSSISGTVVAGPVGSSTVTAYAINANGSSGAVVGTATSGADGSFSIPLSTSSGTPVRLAVSGGSYVSEANVSTTVTGAALSAVFPGSDVTGAAITPITTFVDSRTSVLAAGGMSLSAAMGTADTDIRGVYGLDAPSTSSPSLSMTMPDFTATDGIGAELALILGSLEELAIRDTEPPPAIVSAIASDLGDGKPDGKTAAGKPITYPSGALAPSSLASSDFLGALSEYVDPTNKKTIIVELGKAPSAGTVSSVRGGVVAAAPAAAALSLGSSGAITTLTYSGKQIVYVAGRSFGLQSVDITDPLHPVVNGLTSLNSAMASLLTADGSEYSIGGVVAIPGASTPQLAVFSYGSQRVLVVDAAAQTVLLDSNSSPAFAAALTTETSFSGGSAYISGGIADAGRGVVWLATGEGYIPFDPTTGAISTAYSTIPLVASQYIAENIGGDIAQEDLLFSGNYGPEGSGGGLQIVNLGTGKAYALPDDVFQSDVTIPNGSASPTTFGIVDGGSVDSGYKVGILTGEDRNYAVFVDLHDPTKLTFNDTAMTVTPTTSSIFTGLNFAADGGLAISGSAVESTNHLALFMAGYSNDIVIGKLDNPAAPATGTWTGLSSFRYYTPTDTEYAYATDPHADAAILATANNKSYAFLFSLNGAVLMIDMQAFLSDATGTGDPNELAATPFDGSIIQTLPVTAPTTGAAGSAKRQMAVKQQGRATIRKTR